VPNPHPACPARDISGPSAADSREFSTVERLFWETSATSPEPTTAPGLAHIPLPASQRTDWHLQSGRLCEVDCKAVALALVAAGHFGAGVAEMLLNVRFLNLGGGGEARAQRMAAERQPSVALGSGHPAGRRRARIS
jgi:hypothetical protein